jgi:methylisocitrate lyase
MFCELKKMVTNQSDPVGFTTDFKGDSAMTSEKPTSRLRHLICAKPLLVMPGVYDALSARLAGEAGFEAIVLGGYPATASLLGLPDISFLTLTEMANHVKNITSAVDLPIMVDGDTGHGSLPNVVRTVRELEKAGAAGIFIEDQVFPKRCGHMEGKEVIPAGEMVAKIKTALNARRDPDLVIMARTDARAVTGLDDAIDRANRYREAGADIIFVEAPRDIEEMRRINREVHAPTLANMVEGGKSPLIGAAELAEIGYDAVVFPVTALYAAVRAVREVFKVLKETGGTNGCLDKIVQFSEFSELIGIRGWRDMESRCTTK